METAKCHQESDRPLIHYSVCGEGRGHATRARGAVEELRRDLRVRIFAYGDAWELLSRAYRGSEVRVTKIPGLRFAYGRDGVLDYLATGATSLRYLRGFLPLVDRLTREMMRDRPDLAVTDFEPALPFAARRAGVPYVAFDHQHFLSEFDLGDLPLPLKWKAALLTPFVRILCRGQAQTIVSSFYDAPLRRSAGSTLRVGVLLRPEILRAMPTDAGHLVAYFRKSPAANVLEALEGSGRSVHVYGLGARGSKGRLDFLPTSIDGFVRDLASATALVATAGNQLLGEALYLGKPILAFPEPGNFEQEINAFFLPRTGGGEAYDAHRIHSGLLRQFLRRLDWYRGGADAASVAGNVPAAAAIRGLLRTKVRPSLPSRRRRLEPVHAT